MLYIFEEADKIDDDIPETMLSRLSKNRRTKVLEIKPPLSKKTSVAVYLLLRRALFDVYGIDEVVEFEYTAKGKPLLKDHPHIHFNFSHSKNLASCAVSDNEVGVDIQHIVTVSEAVARRVLSDKEYAGFNTAANKDEYFCEIWTVKESFLKKTGQGITEDIRNITADSVTDKMIYRGMDYFCCVCGNDMAIKQIGREELEQHGK